MTKQEVTEKILEDICSLLEKIERKEEHYSPAFIYFLEGTKERSLKLLAELKGEN